ncbi:MAG TPA: hypothetical protein VHD39_01190 [Acidimicrobiales bacterium]|nr:hypothetical protein [Acidimicrobiales bacterium]
MVLVAPAPPRGRLTCDDATDVTVAPERGSGREVLAQLRGDTHDRPRFDPGLAGGLRAWLEDAAYEATNRSASVVAGSGPLLLGSRQLLGGELEDHDLAGVAPAIVEASPGERTMIERLLPRLVHALFRQIVHTAAVGDPLRDALDAVAVSGRDTAILDHVAALDDTDRAALSAALDRHARHLCALVPRFAPGWLPRTDEYVSIPLAGGRVVLHGAFDLLVGLPRPGTASLCAIGLATGGWARQRRALHFMALLESLRSGAPPFRVALLESATGLYGVEDVREEHLRAMTAHIAAWLTRDGSADG